MSLRVSVDDRICQGHNLCHRALPEVFRLRDEDGHAYVEIDEVPEGLREAVRLAAQTCPEGAIRVADGPR
ncbi:MAG: ferredoxin [Candidatus Dormibacteria bacterium]